MRQYELVAVFPPEEELFRQGKEAVSAELAKHGAAEVKETDMGDRQLAYVIKKKERGRYVLFNLSMDPQNVAPVERMFKLNPNLLKYLFVTVEA
jgi:small subunit ribosomal protein S6